jgi:hypothetical protein
MPSRRPADKCGLGSQRHTFIRKTLEDLDNPHQAKAAILFGAADKCGALSAAL